MDTYIFVGHRSDFDIAGAEEEGGNVDLDGMGSNLLPLAAGFRLGAIEPEGVLSYVVGRGEDIRRAFIETIRILQAIRVNGSPARGR